MFKLSAALKAKGQKAEAAFQAWLDRSGAAFMYIEQSPLTVPKALRGQIRRPDYLVGVPYAGSLAFDVKAKTLYEGQFIFERDEVEKLLRFARLFNLTVYFVCMDEGADHHWWIPVADLAMLPVEWRSKRRVVAFAKEDAYAVALERPFLDAVMGLSRRELEKPV